MIYVTILFVSGFATSYFSTRSIVLTAGYILMGMYVSGELLVTLERNKKEEYYNNTLDKLNELKSTDDTTEQVEIQIRDGITRMEVE